MKRISITVFALLLILCNVTAQQTNPDQLEIEREVNEQVWKPFMDSYASKDSKTFNSLHTDDVLRVSPWGIKLGNEYKESVIKNNSKPDRKKRSIEFWFEHRIYKGDVGYEVGYYRVKPLDGTGDTHYGRFHVVLRKEDGTWKIAQDWDTSNINGYKVGPDDFDNSKVLTF